MNIAFRVDASLNIGSGHVMRCLSLAEHIKKQGHSCIFFTRPQAGSLEELIKSKGFKTIEMNRSEFVTEAKETTEYQNWLQATENDDANDFINKTKNHNLSFEWLIIDHYGINQHWEKKVKQECSAMQVLAIDDLIRTHDVDILLDTTLGRKASSYKNSNIATACLTGSEFALLKPDFNRRREHKKPTMKTEHGIRILISFGGVDNLDATGIVLNTLIDSPNEQVNIDAIDVILHPRSPNFSVVKALTMPYEHITLYEFVEDMATLMSISDIAIGAPGTTSWERACLGLPSILIPIAENQKDNAKALHKADAIQLIEIENIQCRLMTAIQELALKLPEYEAANLKITDGLGIARVYQYLHPHRSTNNDIITLRKAHEEDIQTVYDWQTLPETRRYARNPQIPNWQDHKSWMQKRLNSPSCYFYIIQKNNIPTGVVRLDLLSPQKYEVSFFLSSGVPTNSHLCAK